MTVEENLQKVEAYFEAFNDQDPDRMYGLYAESIVARGPALPEPLKGRAAYREFGEGLRKAFPDVHIELVRAFGQDDWVSYEYTVTGTHKGPFPGPGGETIPATNKTVHLDICTVAKIEGGRFTEEHNYFDLLGMMTQLGLAP